MKFRLVYNSEVIKGREIVDFFEKYDNSLVIMNERVESFKNSPKAQINENSLKKTVLLCMFFLMFNMLLPFTGEWYNEFIIIPKQMKILSFAVILNMLLSAYVF